MGRYSRATFREIIIIVTNDYYYDTSWVWNLKDCIKMKEIILVAVVFLLCFFVFDLGLWSLLIVVLVGGLYRTLTDKKDN